MHTLICDLDQRERDALDLPETPDVIVGREALEASAPCRGCFRCWTETPGRCVMRDRLQDLGALLGATDRLDIISASCFGGYSPLVKRALDRALPYLHPNFRIVDGQMHHRLRYPQSLRQRIWLYGTRDDGERTTFLGIARANEVNLGTQVEGIWFPERARDAGRPDGALGALGVGSPVTDAPVLGAPGAPQRIALINASPKAADSATEHLLADFVDALGAYACLSGSPVPKIIDAHCTLRGELSAPNARKGGVDLSSCEAIVIGYPLYVDALPAHLAAWLERAAREGALASGTKLYAICNLGSYEAEQALSSLGILRGFCHAAGVSWCGGLAIGGGGMIVPFAHSPRMGGMRRARSEGIDALIAAVRMGLTVQDANERFGREACGLDPSAILARCPTPRAIYKLAAEALWRKLARANHADLDAQPRCDFGSDGGNSSS